MAGPLKGYLWSTSSSYDYILGEYEDPAVLRQFLGWLKPGTVLYDIGANVGYHALIANSILPTGTIYAFEPMPFVRTMFEKHIALNSGKISNNNITILPMAVSDKAGEVEFSNDAVHREGNTYIPQSYVFKGSADKITVQCQSIDGLVEQGYKIPAILKIDVEGAEYDVLLGARHTIAEHKPDILLATHDCHLPGVQQKCVALLQELGYQLQHTGEYHKYMDGIDNYIAIHNSKL